MPKPATVKRLIGFSPQMNKVIRKIAGDRPHGPAIERLLRDHPEVQEAARKLRLSLPERLLDSRGKRGRLVRD